MTTATKHYNLKKKKKKLSSTESAVPYILQSRIEKA